MHKILLIDDSGFQRRLIKRLLNDFPCEFDEAGDGSEGLEKLSNNTYNLIILDLLMPKIDGFGVLKALKENNDPIPVIVVTADIQSEVIQECKELGARAILNKPPDGNSLMDKVTELLT